MARTPGRRRPSACCSKWSPWADHPRHLPWARGSRPSPPNSWRTFWPASPLPPCRHRLLLLPLLAWPSSQPPTLAFSDSPAWPSALRLDSPPSLSFRRPTVCRPPPWPFARPPALPSARPSPVALLRPGLPCAPPPLSPSAQPLPPAPWPSSRPPAWPLAWLVAQPPSSRRRAPPAPSRQPGRLSSCWRHSSSTYPFCRPVGPSFPQQLRRQLPPCPPRLWLGAAPALRPWPPHRSLLRCPPPPPPPPDRPRRGPDRSASGYVWIGCRPTRPFCLGDFPPVCQVRLLLRGRGSGRSPPTPTLLLPPPPGGIRRD
mmetsp:Transcript_176793/g.567053  ORF Transcript_176793/g.567053 Transcript_176793/m.567053 type:complete len:314 (+) Transcript_176793:1575-2516(+)